MFSLFKKRTRTQKTDLYLYDFCNHLKILGTDNNEFFPATVEVKEEYIYPELDNPITKEEIQKVISNLKSKPSHGIDNILNFIALQDICVSMFSRLFNVI